MGRGKKGILLALALAGAVTVGLGAAAICCNRLRLELTLRGQDQVMVEYGEGYEDPGAGALVYGTLFWRSGIQPSGLQVAVENPPDLTKTGKYTVTYRATYRDLTAQTTRIVRVVDTMCPEITLTADAVTPEPGQPYVEAGYRAYDNYDGDITHRVIRREEYGLVTYAVVDSSGNPAYAERTIPAGDFQEPELTLTGGETLSIPVGTFYEEPGYLALDNLDGNVTDRVTVEGEVDWLHPGTYSLVYSASDTAGNTARVTRTVEVTCAQRPKTIWPQGKVIYLTFDDGPGPDTGRLLNLLDRYGVKATFFVTDSGYPNLLEQIVNRGHGIGIHTASHKYEQIYADPESYFTDLHKMRRVILEATGVDTTLLRFPGGSSNTVSRHTCEGLMTTLVEAVQDAGFQYFDWNVDSDDAGSAREADEVLENVKAGVAKQKVAMVLQHDVHSYSVDAVEDILIWGLNNGYRFEALTPNSPGMHHNVYN